MTDAATDAQRSLSGRGRRDAAAAGRWLAERGLTPDVVVLSPAARAQQTWANAAEAVAGARLICDERVYANTVEDLLAVLFELPDEVATVALVGHNPSMHALADALDDGNGDADAQVALRAGYPTCAIAVFDVPGPWLRLAPGGATLQALVVPRG